MKIDFKQIGIGAAIAALLAAFAMLLYTPLQKSLHGIKAVRSATAIIERSAREELSEIPQLRTQLAAMQVRVGNYDAKIPNDRQLGLFLGQIAESMNKYGLKDQFVEPQEEIKAGKLMCIPVRMQCSGSMQELFGFFRALNKLERMMRIESVELKNAKEIGNAVAMAVKLNIYFSPETGKQ
jgi:Tfp pilus assembly protein PilO